jgi:hypothetical protein
MCGGEKLEGGGLSFLDSWATKEEEEDQSIMYYNKTNLRCISSHITKEIALYRYILQNNDQTNKIKNPQYYS